ncbi:hypothetical protein PY32053_04290 (plasmid) [Paracoccus yeei]|uniref:Uncharacterized protein n=1 Tax=Paracoccus yeei TaxID=147645 RepID=A0A386UT45_9RHOB|nr:hypothetical protein PY32053_04290 [Paracoccus yeei]
MMSFNKLENIMKNTFVAALTVASIVAGFAHAEEASHSTRGSQSGIGGDHSSVNDTAEKPEPISGSASPTSTMPVPAGRIMSPKELNRAGLKPDDVIMHVSVF